MKKNISVSVGLIFLMTILPFTNINAQSMEDIKMQMVKDWQRAKEYTVDYLNTMPADKYSFKAVDSIRSFAQQMLHIAQVNYFLMAAGTDLQQPAFVQSDMEHSPSAQAKDSVMYYVEESYDFCLNGIKGFDAGKFFEKKKIFSFEESRFAILNKAFEHQTHHRGQSTIYIRLQGIRPPGERLF